MNTTILDHDATMAVAPALAPEMVAGSIYQADAGTAHHDAVVWGYARAAARNGARIHPWTEVTGITVDGQGVSAVTTARGTIASRTVIVAGGGFSRKVSQLPSKRLRPPRQARSTRGRSTQPGSVM